MLLLIALLLLPLLLLVVRRYRRWPVTSPTSTLIKGPKHWPLLGATLEALSTLDRHHDWITDYARHFQTFDITLFPSKRLIFTTHPPNLEHFLKTNFANYYKGTIAYDVQHELLGEGIFNTDGESWKQQRKAASFEFSTKNLRQRSIQTFRKNAIKLASILAHTIASQQNSVNMNELFMRLSLDSICEIGFGVEMGALSASMPAIPFAQAFDSANVIIARRFFNPVWKVQRLLNIGVESKLRKDVQLLNKFTTNLIQKRREQLSQESPQETMKSENSDLLSRFLTLNQESAILYSEMRLRDMILNFVIAGRDTTATAMSWFFYCVSQQPEVQSKLLQEINGIWKTSKGDTVCHSKNNGNTPMCSCTECMESYGAVLDYELLTSMHYLHGALCETLRLYPVVPEDGRMARGNDVLPDGTLVRAGDIVLYASYAMGRMEYLWGVDALEFKPERWLSNDGVFEAQSPFKFPAFHAGPRTCLGKEFAFLQMKMTIAILLKFFKFELVAKNHDVKYSLALTLSMSNGLEMHVEHI